MDANKLVRQKADQAVRENRLLPRFAGHVEDVFFGGTDANIGEPDNLASLRCSQKNFQSGDGVR